MAITASFDPTAALLNVRGDSKDNVIALTRAADNILVNNGAVPAAGGTPTISNTTVIQASGGAGDDRIDASALGAAAIQLELRGNAGDDTILGGSGKETLRGGA